MGLFRFLSYCTLVSFFYNSLMHFSPLNFTHSPTRAIFSFLCLLVGIFCIGWSVFSEKTPRDMATLLLIDNSLSMSVTDMIGSGNISLSRLDATKDLVRQILSFSPDTRVGLASFSEWTQILSPLSPDIKTLLYKLDAIIPRTSGASTDIAHSLENIATLYPKTPLHIICISDGEETTPDAKNPNTFSFPDGTRFSWISVGTALGGPIPEWYDGLGNIRYKEFWWQKITSKSHPESLENFWKKFGWEVFVFSDMSQKEKIAESLKNELSSKDKHSPISFVLIFGVLLCGIWIVIHPYRLIL